MARTGFWLRVAAMLIDIALLGIPILLVYLAVAYPMGGFEDEVTAETEARIERVFMVIVYLLVLAYSSFEIWKAATPGKMLLKLEIRSADASIAPLGNRTTRWYIKQSPQIIGLFAVLFSKRVLETVELIAAIAICISFLLVLRRSRRAWYDDLAGTAVFRPGQEEPHGFEPILTAAYAPPQAPYPPPPDPSAQR